MLRSAFQKVWSPAVLTPIIGEVYLSGSIHYWNNEMLHMYVLLRCNHAVGAVQEMWDLMIFSSLNAGDC